MPKIITFLGYDPVPASADLGVALRRRRTVLGLSQEAASKALNLDPSTIRRWEKGKGEPSAKYLSAVLTFLG